MTEEKYGAAWAAMAKREGHMRGVPSAVKSTGRPLNAAPVSYLRGADIEALMAERGEVTVDDIREAFGLTKTQVRHGLQIVFARNKVKRTRRGVQIVYALEVAA